jgi:hypothetical protein
MFPVLTEHQQCSRLEIEHFHPTLKSRCTEVADDTDGLSATTMGSGMMAIVGAAQVMLL